MILRLFRHIVDCPVCGRPAEIQLRHIGQEVACGHCRGHFVVHAAKNEGLIAARMDGTDLLERAEQLLRLAD